jgi:hypothetical protein
MKIQQPQVEQDRTQTLTEFRKDGQVNLKRGEGYKLTSIAVTSDNRLLINLILYSSDTVTPFSYLSLVVLCIVSSVDKLYGFLPWKSNYCFI